MAKRVLTARTLKALKPALKGKRIDHMDAVVPGFGVRVTDKVDEKGRAAQRTFILVARYPGSTNPTRRALGEFDQRDRLPRATAELASATLLTLEEARDKARLWLDQLARRVDPREEQREAARARAAASAAAAHRSAQTFGAVMEEYLTRQVRKQRKAKDVEREIRKELLPRWQHKLVSEIAKDDIIAMAKEIADRGAPYQAHNCFGHARTFFAWLQDSGQATRYGLGMSPCYGIKPARLIGAKKPRQRVLSDVELAAYWRAASRMRYPFGPMFQMLLLTGQRKSDVAKARWREFDFAQNVWTIPPERFKSDAVQLVPMAGQAATLVKALPQWVGGDFLFSTTAGRKPVSGFSKAKARLDQRMLRTLKALARKRGDDPKQVTLEPFVIHDVRRTVRTQLSKLRVPFDVAELVIGHTLKGLSRVYDQHAYLDERREALEAWVARLREIVEPPPANVVKLRTRAR
jgi:integrase